MERPQLDLSVPDTGVKKSYTPAQGTLESQLSLTGAALDPMRGRFIPESDPRAQKILAERAKLQGAKKKKKGLEPGERVFHAKRQEYGVVAKHPEGNRVEVIFPRGKKALVQTANLEKVK